jgi:phosphatidylethanolamine/phosphatidyl-N-methylethanolamine N-methyltransferase
MTLDQIEKVYDRYSSVYDFIFKPTLNNGRKMAPQMLELFSGAKLLEIGVGTGLSLPYMPEDVEIIGIDISEKMLQKAAQRVQKLERKTIQLARMDATNLSFEDDTFDRVLSAYTISTVPDPIQVVREMKRVCKPNGYILFLNHFAHHQPFMGFVEKTLSPLCCKMGFRTDLDLHYLLGETNLELECIEKIDISGNWKAVKCLNTKEMAANEASEIASNAYSC